MDVAQLSRPPTRLALGAVTVLLIASLGSAVANADDDVPGACVAGCRWLDGVLVCDQPCESSATSDDGGEAHPRRGGPPVARFKLGLVAAVPGPRVADATSETVGGGLGGIDVELHLGRPQLGFDAGLGVWGTRMTAPPLGADPVLPVAFLGWVGLTSSPGALVRRPTLELRPDFGIDAMFGYCDTCRGVAGYGARIKVGLDLYLGAPNSGGVALDLLAPILTLGSLGDDPVEVELPAVAVRISIVLRNLNLAGW